MGLFGIISQTPYRSLYENTDKFVILVSGGRASGKSFNIATFIERLSFERGHKILFTRYTMSSASVSVIPEFQEKAEMDLDSVYFDQYFGKFLPIN